MVSRGAPSGSPSIRRGAGPFAGSSRFITVAAILAAFSMTRSAAPPAAAQTPAPDGIRSDSLASAVPASARFFIELDRLAPHKDSGRAAKANQIYELLVGSHDARTGISADWRRTLRGLGIKPGDAAKALFSHRMAIAAPSWQRLAEGIILVRIRGDDPIIRDTFPPTDMDVIDDARGAIVYRTRTVLSAATNGKTLILSQRRTPESLYRQAVQIMMDDTLPTLAARPDFQRALNAAADIDGWIYIDTARPEGFPLLAAGPHRSPISVAMDLSGQGVEFTVQTSVKPAGADQSPVSLQRVQRLPQTTVAAFATRFDARRAFREIMARGFDNSAPGWLKHLADVFDVESVAEGFFGKLGSDAVVAWDQHLGDGPDIPQIALLIESSDPAACADLCAEVLQAIVDWLDLRKPPTDRRLRLAKTEYLGTPIYEIIWNAPSASPAGMAASAIIDRPTFAPLDNVFVLATGPDQVRNIIDARLGLAPKLADLDEFRDFNRRTRDPIMAAVVQPALAAQVVDNWLKDRDGTLQRWFDGMMGADHAVLYRRRGHPKLGIGVQPDVDPGTVTVARVYPGGRAHGHLRPGDRIVGLNGTLLALDDPAADLRRRVLHPPATGRWVFRIQRGDLLLDAVVPTVPPRRVSQTVTDPAGALRQLQSLFQLVDFAGIRITRPTPDTINAKLALRFAPTPQLETRPPNAATPAAP